MYMIKWSIVPLSVAEQLVWGTNWKTYVLMVRTMVSAKCTSNKLSECDTLGYKYSCIIYIYTTDISLYVTCVFTFVGQNPHKKVRIQRLLRCVCQLLRVPSLLVLLWNGEDITRHLMSFREILGVHGVIDMPSKNCELTPRTPWINRSSFVSVRLITMKYYDFIS